MSPPDALPVTEDPGADLETTETPEEAKARALAAFGARGPRYARWAEAFAGSPDPFFAMACEVVDHEARLDALARDVDALRFKLSQHVEASR